MPRNPKPLAERQAFWANDKLSGQTTSFLGMASKRIAPSDSKAPREGFELRFRGALFLHNGKTDATRSRDGIRNLKFRRENPVISRTVVGHGVHPALSRQVLPCRQFRSSPLPTLEWRAGQGPGLRFKLVGGCQEKEKWPDITPLAIQRSECI